MCVVPGGISDNCAGGCGYGNSKCGGADARANSTFLSVSFSYGYHSRLLMRLDSSRPSSYTR